MQGVDIKVWGRYACFTRPEFKVERVSYPVMTPAAARGLLEAIYWKPKIRYRVLRIGVLSLGTQTTILRNEISSRQSPPSKKATPLNHCVIADSGQQRQQRTSLVLQDVAYRIQARIELRNGETNIGKHLDCARRRIARGQYYQKPYFGCREFAAEFEPADEKADVPGSDLNLQIGTMLFDTAYVEDPEWHANHKENRLEFWRHDEPEPRIAEGVATRLFFAAEVKNGWLAVPGELFKELRGLEDQNGDY